MLEMIAVLSALVSVAALFYFRYTDSRNVTVAKLQDYLHQSENHIEKMLRQKEKFFEDRMINAEVLIERIQKTSKNLEQKIALYHESIDEGDQLHQVLVNEIQEINVNIGEFRQIHLELRDMEDKIQDIHELKGKLKNSEEDLANIQHAVKEFSKDFQNMNQELKQEGRDELKSFINGMQKDLSSYLSQSRIQMEKKEQAFQEQISTLNQESKNISQQIEEFQFSVVQGFDGLQQSYEEDLQMAKIAFENQVTIFFDTITQLKEKMNSEKEDIHSVIESQQKFFEDNKQNLLDTIQEFQQSTSDTQRDLAHRLENDSRDFLSIFENRVHEVNASFNEHSIRVQEHLQDILKQDITTVRNEMERIQSAFVDQEQMQSEKTKEIQQNLNEILYLAENKIKQDIDEWHEQIVQQKEFASTSLEEAKKVLAQKIEQLEEEFRQQATEQMEKIESGYQESNREQLQLAIKNITDSLEGELRSKYEGKVTEVSNTIDELGENVNEAKKLFETLYADLDTQKSQIIQMTEELKQDQEQTVEAIIDQVQERLDQTQENMVRIFQQLTQEEQEKLSETQNRWQENYQETLSSANSNYNKIRSDIEEISTKLNTIADDSLHEIRRHAEQIERDSQARLEDFRTLISENIRSSKEELHLHQDKAREEIKRLRSELKDNEQQLIQSVELNCERLDRRVRETDERIADFNKKTARIDEVENLVNEMSQQVHNVHSLKNELVQMNDALKDSSIDGHKVLDAMNAIQERYDVKISELNDFVYVAEQKRELLDNQLHEVIQAQQIFENWDAVKERVDVIDEMLGENLSKYNDLQENLQNLENKRQTVEEILTQVNESHQELSVLQENSRDLATKVDQMRESSLVIQDQMIEVQRDLSSYSSEKEKLHRAVEALENLEFIIDHAESERQSIERMLDLLQKNASRLNSSNEPSNSITDEQVSTIIRLSEQNWTKMQIAKHLQIKPSLVEFTIQRYKN